MRLLVNEQLLDEDQMQHLLDHPAVAAVIAVVMEADRQYRRAEAAHDAKDEANRRWLELASRNQGDK